MIFQRYYALCRYRFSQKIFVDFLILTAAGRNLYPSQQTLICLNKKKNRNFPRRKNKQNHNIFLVQNIDMLYLHI